MILPGFNERRQLESLDRISLAQLQLDKLNHLLSAILPANRFYAQKLADCPREIRSLDELSEFPCTTKEELLGPGKEPGFAANVTYPVERYVRYHQTSGTRGRPLVVLDTPQDWKWWIGCWQYVLDAADVGPEDRAVLAFSFGPFIGFWSAHDALVARSVMVVPAGGMSTLARLRLIESSRATVLFCTPTYALRMVEVANDQGIDLRSMAVRRIVVAGEPGGSIPATRARIESAWGARVIDHSGASEVGPWGYGDALGRGLHVLESEFIAEFLAVGTNEPARPGELAHLVLTTLGRQGSPVIRYRTGDLVRPVWDADPGGSNRFVMLEGGILGRADDMIIIRGVNVFPSSIEHILYGFPDVVVYRLTARKQGALDQLLVEVEDRQNQPHRIAEELQVQLGLKVDVRAVPMGSLPRGQGKGIRFVDEQFRLPREPNVE